MLRVPASRETCATRVRPSCANHFTVMAGVALKGLLSPALSSTPDFLGTGIGEGEETTDSFGKSLNSMGVPRRPALVLDFIFFKFSAKQPLRAGFNRVAENQISFRDELREIRGEVVVRET